jgi:hypothetical protein
MLSRRSDRKNGEFLLFGATFLYLSSKVEIAIGIRQDSE